MLVTLWWWLITDVDDKIIMLVTFFVMLVIFSMYLIANILNRSPTSQTCHQHILSPTSVINIDITNLNQGRNSPGYKGISIRWKKHCIGVFDPSFLLTKLLEYKAVIRRSLIYFIPSWTELKSHLWFIFLLTPFTNQIRCNGWSNSESIRCLNVKLFQNILI